MLGSYIFKTVTAPKQILFGEWRATLIVFSLAGVGMLLTCSPLAAGFIVFILHPVNVWLTRIDPYYIDIFTKAWFPLLKNGLHKTKKETMDA